MLVSVLQSTAIKPNPFDKDRNCYSWTPLLFEGIRSDPLYNRNSLTLYVGLPAAELTMIVSSRSWYLL